MSNPRQQLVNLVLAALLFGACAAAPNEPAALPGPAAHSGYADALENLPRGAAQTARVCERGGADLVRDVFCTAAPPSITSLPELHAAFGVGSGKIGGFTGVAVAGHTTALATRSVSQINPRVIFVRLEAPNVQPIALAFVRGEQLAEVVVRDRVDRELRFYVLAFRQACNAAAGGCSFGDLLTPAIERDWTEHTLYDERDLANTVLDCATCHQADGPGTTKLLRMQELETPWTHWFFKGTEGGRALLEDYLAAKGDEPLAGLTGREIEYSHPGSLNMLALYSGGYRQPNRFESQLIEDEVRASAAALGGRQPYDNSIPGDSPTWRSVYEQARRGEAMPVPYHDVKATDPAKLARMSAVYQQYRRGELQASELPDIRDVLPDDELRLARMGIMTEPGASGSEVLLQACSQCHNPKLDPTLSRARFRADLLGISQEERELAIQRLSLPADDPLVMPPARLRVLSPEARMRAIDALRQ